MHQRQLRSVRMHNGAIHSQLCAKLIQAKLTVYIMRCRVWRAQPYGLASTRSSLERVSAAFTVHLICPAYTGRCTERHMAVQMRTITWAARLMVSKLQLLPLPMTASAHPEENSPLTGVRQPSPGYNSSSILLGHAAGLCGAQMKPIRSVR